MPDSICPTDIGERVWYHERGISFTRGYAKLQWDLWYWTLHSSHRVEEWTPQTTQKKSMWTPCHHGKTGKRTKNWWIGIVGLERLIILALMIDHCWFRLCLLTWWCGCWRWTVSYWVILCGVLVSWWVGVMYGVWKCDDVLNGGWYVMVLCEGVMVLCYGVMVV